MGSDHSCDLSFVSSTTSGCQIFRETSGCYVVTHQLSPDLLVTTPTLAGAYAACHGWEHGQPSSAAAFSG